MELQCRYMYLKISMVFFSKKKITQKTFYNAPSSVIGFSFLANTLFADLTASVTPALS